MVRNSTMEKSVVDGLYSARTRNSFNSAKATVTLERERWYSTLNSMLYRRPPHHYSPAFRLMPMSTSVLTIEPPLTLLVSTNQTTNMPDGHSTTLQNSTYSAGRSEQYGVPHTAISQAMTMQTLWQKKGASGNTPCQYTTTTKTWLLSQARSQLLRRWKAELPLSAPSFKFPNHLRDVEWKETRAIWRVFSNRSPSDPHPNQADDPCPCGSVTNSSHHLLRDCVLLATHRAKLLASSVGDIQTSDFITNPKNFIPLCRFLRATGLGHTKNLCFDQNPTSSDNGSDNLGSPEPDFGVFEF